MYYESIAHLLYNLKYLLFLKNSGGGLCYFEIGHNFTTLMGILIFLSHSQPNMLDLLMGNVSH